MLYLIIAQYCIAQIIHVVCLLLSSFITCKSWIGHPINKEKDRISKYHDEFYQREKNNPFDIAANVKEIKIESENKSQIEIAENIQK